MKPKAVKSFCPDTKRFIFLDEDQVENFDYVGKTEKVGSVRCAVFKNKDGKALYQPWEKFSFLRRKGEKNINSKLKTYQVRQIVKDVYLKPQGEVTFKSIADRYGVTEETISDIAHGRAWYHVTVGLIAQLKAGNKTVLDACITASNKEPRKKNVKLNASLAKFIVRDHMLNKISVKKLADKFNLSESSIRRIVTGKVWKSATVPAIAEFTKWNK